jgi:hypothetical protein
MKHIVKRIGIESQPDLMPIFLSAFGKSPKLSQISQKHSTDFTGLRDVGYLAYAAEDQPVAFYGVFPIEVRVDGKFVMVAQSGDTMVIEEHRKYGLFTLLANETYKLCKASNIAGVFGFPSPSSYPGFVKRLGWGHIENIKKFQFLIPTVPLAEISVRLSVFTNAILRWNCFLARLMFPEGVPFEGSILDEKLDGIRRTDGYWKYKLNSDNVKLIRLKGCDVVIKFGESLGIGDINYDTLKDLRRVMSMLKVLCFFCGINRIVFYTSPETKLDRDLSKIGKSKEGLPIGFRSFVDGVDMRKLKFCYLDMDTY